jgi:uncharacterized protein (TIGR00369 family)
MKERPAAGSRPPLGALYHPACIACRPRSAGGLGLVFDVRPDGSVEALFPGGDPYQGYNGILHGGVIATLLDAAMMNCLFAQGHCAVTAELTVRFRHPVVSREPSRLRAWTERCTPPLFVARAELWQSGQRRATAVGKFFASTAAARAEGAEGRALGFEG